MLDHGFARAAIFTFAVEEVAFVRAGGQPRRVLSLRRLDELNLRHTLLGRQGDEHGDPVVLLDQVDCVRQRARDANARTARAIRSAMVRGARRSTVLVPRTLPVKRCAASSKPRSATRSDLRVTPKPATRSHASLRRACAATRRATAIDRDRETPLRYPKQLAAYVPNDDKQLALRTRAELAAYLSQIGNDPVTPQFALWNLASLTFNRERWDTAEFYAGVVIIEGLARQLGIASPGPALIHDSFERQRLVAVAEPLAAQSSEKLRAAARQLWIELYGEPMLPIVDLLR